ncbi:MAG: sigma-70 family RNA polymerase sigma factor [Bacteroidota bacterium]
MTKQEFRHTISPIKDKLYRFALRIMDSVPEAEDVVQEVMIKLWKQRDRLAQIANLEAWSVKMTRNVSIDKLRARKHSEDVSQLIDLETDIARPDQLVEQKDTFAMIEKAMQQLPEKQRLVMHLRDIEECSYKEIAEQLEMPLNQVKVNLFRARKSVRTLLTNTQFNLI